MRVAVLDILAPPEKRLSHLFYHLVLTKQYASVMPQAVSVWCRQAGHDVHYDTYYGVGDPLRRIPLDADMVFLSCYTQVSPIAYALAKILRRHGIITVLGGPHAKSFPRDAIRFFDYVVGECDRDLVMSLLRREHAPGSIVSSKQPPRELPLVEERLPEIIRSSLFFGRARSPTTTIALLSSLGCPYTCSFCIDWKSEYRLMPADRLVEDLRFIGQRFPRALVAFHDPNFAIKFDETLAALETQAPGARLPYLMESSLSVLKPSRMARLAETNCVFVAPGIESWDDFSNKSNGAAMRGMKKVESVVNQFTELHEHVSSLQANFIFGLDTDCGDAPIDLLKEFMDRAPFVWPTLNIPVPFGGTPLFDELRKSDRILEAMPFRFYYAPYSVTKIRHYDPCSYYRRLIELFEHCSSREILARRMASRRTKTEKLVDVARANSVRAEIEQYRQILHRLETDAELRGFHEGTHRRLPAFYRTEYRFGLGRYADLLDDDERRPVLDQDSVAPPPKRRAHVEALPVGAEVAQPAVLPLASPAQP